MGKILIEKLLRSCPDVGGIYVLIRQKKDQEPSKRLLEYLKNPVSISTKLVLLYYGPK
nr:unnamed protein product [Callosobruchus chinensis]